MSVQQLSAVFERSRSRNGARLVLLSIANHDGDGGSWPTISTISRESALTERSVHEALRRLQDDGELKVHPNAGGTMDWRNDRRPNRYEIMLPDGVEDSATPSTNGVGVSSERGGRLRRDGVGDSATQTVQEPSTKSSTRAILDQGFLEFWAIYPRKKAKRAALLAWERAIRRASEEYGGLDPAMANVLAGARRYRSLRRGQEERFTAYPATWLNADDWDDEFREDQPRTVEDDRQKLIDEYNSIKYT